MRNLKKLADPRAYAMLVRKAVRSLTERPDPNDAGRLLHPPGHFYSPLLDIASFGKPNGELSFDGRDFWEFVDLNREGQIAFFREALSKHARLPFPQHEEKGWRYHIDNGMFCLSDAFTLSAVIRKFEPKRIVEVGSGFSSAVMLDTLERQGLKAELTFVEPYPERLYSVLTESDRQRTTIHEKRVQEVPMSVFETLGDGDLLFIDSSHVAKVGSDVTFLFLRVLPRLRPGVIVHVHDMFYPESYPASWILRGRAWNESLFLRAFLVGNRDFQVLAFNSFIARECPELFRDEFPAFLGNQTSGGIEMGAGGASFWMRKVS